MKNIEVSKIIDPIPASDGVKDRAKGIQVSVLDEEKDIVSRTPLISEVKDQYTYTFVNGSGEWV
jgi:hypothetical protein